MSKQQQSTDLQDKTGAGDSSQSGEGEAENNGQQGTSASETAGNGQGGTSTPGNETGAGDGQQGDPDTFPREYVERLRTESGAHRTRARDLASELHGLRVQSLGLLADPTDLPYSEGLDSVEAVKAAAEALIEKKPHLRARKVGGDIGQHHETGGGQSLGLLGRMRRNA